jgi:hypothetical protein
VTSLSVWSIVYYLTTAGEGGPIWRSQDWLSNRIIKSIKGESFQGYVDLAFQNGTTLRFDDRNKDELVQIVCKTVARRVASLVLGHFTIVPIPNSSAALSSKQPFRTEELARQIAKCIGVRVNVSAALRWKKALLSAHKGGPRDPDVLLDNLQLGVKPSGPIVVFDDIMTTGGHMVACGRCLADAGLLPVKGIVVGRATGEQQPVMVEWREEELQIEAKPFDWNF